MLPAFDGSRNFGPVIAEGVVKFKQLIFFLGGPLLMFDGAVEVVVVSLPALFSTPVVNVIFLFKYSGYFGPFFDPAVLIKFLKSFIFLSQTASTFVVHAFLSVMQ